MEENIKKIEEIINWLKDSSYPYDISLTRDDIQSLENLIKGYRELKEITNTYDAFANDYIPNNTKMIIADREYFNNGIFNESFIPKSQIKSKIEELDKQRIKMEKDDIGVGFTLGNNWSDLKAKIQVLQELMEDK